MPAATRKASRTLTATQSRKSVATKAPGTAKPHESTNASALAPSTAPKQHAVDAAKANGPDAEKSAKKAKVVRDSFTMPGVDYDKLAELKSKCLAAGVSVKKSELLRVGLHLLEALPIAGLTAAVTALENVKTGRKAVEKPEKNGRIGKGH